MANVQSSGVTFWATVTSFDDRSMSSMALLEVMDRLWSLPRICYVELQSDLIERSCPDSEIVLK